MDLKEGQALVRKELDQAKGYALAVLRWCVMGLCVGAICGTVGAIFHHGIQWAVEQFGANPWLLYLLPVGGLIITALYHFLGLTPDPGTNAVLRASDTGEPVNPRLAVAIFFSTILTQLVGGSGGREGAALQLGGSIGGYLGQRLGLGRSARRTITLGGMAAVFSALFGTPVTAALFCLEVVRVGAIPYAALVPCLISSLTADQVSRFLGMEPTAFALKAIPALTGPALLQCAALGVLGGLVAILFCEGQHLSQRLFGKISNPWIRVMAGSVLLILLTLLLDSRRYNGAGMAYVTLAIEEGDAQPLGFLLKILFTAITLGCGFKGGEIVPCFYTGAAFGCVAAPLVGMDPGLGAALGMVTVFCGAVNSPLASLVLAVEVFGGDILPLAALPVALGYLVSGRCSLYKNQMILNSKLDLES